MDLRKQINEWLEKGTYKQGIELYAQCKGVNKALLRRLRRSKLPWAKNKLRYELERLGPTQETLKPKFTIIQPIRVVPKEEHRHDTNFEDEDSQRGKRTEWVEVSAPPPKTEVVEPFAVAEIKRLRNRAYRERDHLHANLESYKTDEERYIAAKRIVELQNLIDGYWQQLDGFDQTGVVPTLPEELDIKKNILSKVKRQKIVGPNISRRKKWIEKELQKKLPNADKIAKWRNELKDLETELKELNAYLDIGK